MINNLFSRSKIIEKNKTFTVLLLIFTLGLFIRFYQLGEVPYGLHDDEVANTYVTKYVLLNGVDIHGNPYPLLYFDKFGDFPPILPMYVSGLSALLFGSTVMGSRILVAIIGALTVFPMYYLALLIFKRKGTALFSALIMAIAPWHIILSRVNAEGVTALFVYLTGVTVFLYGIDKKRLPWLIVSTPLLFLTYFLYPSFRVIIPLTLLVSPLLLFNKFNWQTVFNFSKLKEQVYKSDLMKYKKISILLIVTILLSFILTLTISSTEWGKGRFDQTSIFNDVSGVRILQERLIFNEDNLLLARIANNKILMYGRYLLNNYSTYFTPEYLFFYGGEPEHYTVPNNGLFYISLLVLLLISIFGYFQKKNKEMQYPYFWYSVWLLLITPIPAALTVIAVPSVHRSIAMIPFFIVIFTYGFNALSQIRIKNISVSYILIVLIALEFLLFSHNYFQHTNMLTGIHRNDGTKQLVEYVNKNKDKYQEIQITNEERWFALYYLYYNNNFDPKYTGKFSKHDFRIDKIGKLNLIDTPCVTRQILEDSFKKGLMTVSKDTLIIDKISCIEELEKDYTTEDLPYKKIDTIHRYDGSDAFYIYEPITDYDLSKIGL